MMNGMETLGGHVRGIDDQFQPRMPRRIDTCRKNGVITHVHLLDLSIISDDCTAEVLTGMKLHALRVILLVVMTVNALSSFFKTAEHIVIDDTLVIVLQTTLTDGQRLVIDK